MVTGVRMRRTIALAVITASAVLLAACLIPTSKAGSAAAPRLAGSYPTSLEIMVDTYGSLPRGFTGVRTWRFVRRCSSGACTTTLLRPSILPGNTHVYRYPLHLITGSTYRGQLDRQEICYGPTKVLRAGSLVEHQLITIWPTRTSAGKVVAFSGKLELMSRPSKWGRAQGCIATGFQTALITSPA